MNIKIIGVPVFQGCGIKGVETAPDYLRSKGLLNILKNNHDVTDLGNINIISKKESQMFDSCKDIKYCDVLLDMNTKIANSVKDIVEQGGLPIIIGGDHSLGAGSVAGTSLALNGNIGVVWFDAHADMNTNITSPSKNYHGMSLGTSLYVGDEKMRAIGADKPKVKAKNTFLVATRDMDKGEVELRDSKKVNHVTVNLLRQKGATNTATEIIEALKHNGISNLHLSFDLDALSPETTSAYNCPVSGGVTLQECVDFISTLAKSGMLRSIDYTEYNPEKDKDGTGFKATSAIFEALSTYLH